MPYPIIAMAGAAAAAVAVAGGAAKPVLSRKAMEDLRVAGRELAVAVSELGELSPELDLYMRMTLTPFMLVHTREAKTKAAVGEMMVLTANNAAWALQEARKDPGILAVLEEPLMQVLMLARMHEIKLLGKATYLDEK